MSKREKRNQSELDNFDLDIFQDLTEEDITKPRIDWTGIDRKHFLKVYVEAESEYAYDVDDVDPFSELTPSAQEHWLRWYRESYLRRRNAAKSEGYLANVRRERKRKTGKSKNKGLNKAERKAQVANQKLLEERLGQILKSN